MKMNKRLAQIVAGTLFVTGSFSNLYAGESKMSQVAAQYQTINGAIFRATTQGDLYNDHEAPVISDPRVVTINSKLCMMVHVTDAHEINEVQINGKSASRYNGSTRAGDYYIENAYNGSYSVYTRDICGNTRLEYKTFNVYDTTKPTVELSQTFKNDKCYLVIKVSDNSSISSLTVNGSSVSCSSSGETIEYRVTKSGKYTVIAKDAAGNTTTEKYEVDVDATAPTLKLDKLYQNGKWYLTIKVTPNGDATISKVTVDGSSVSCKSSGGTIEYAISKTGTYKVVVKDSYSHETSDSLYIDTSNTDSTYKPSLTLSQTNSGTVPFLVISASPSSKLSNNQIAKVTVNGVAIYFAGAGGSTRYPVSGAGAYTVVVTDSYGNENSQTYNITSPTAVVQPNTNVNSSSSNVVFALNKKTWMKNGISQTMDAAPIAKYGRIYIPIRYVAYALNIDASKVTWDTKTRSAIIYDGSNTVKVPLGSKTMTVNGVSQTMEAASITYNQRVYIPISQVAKAFKGVQMSWNNNSKQITIIR